MGWKMLYRIDKGGRAADNMQKEVDEVYELESANDFNAFLASLKRKGGTVIERRNGLAFYFTVEAIDVERRAPMPNGRVQVVATLTLALLKQSKNSIPPWKLAPYRFRTSSALVEETTQRFYPGVGDLVCPHGSYDPKPFVNTAGSRMTGKTTCSVAKISFSYNVPASAFDPKLVWAPIGKINLRTVVVCGMKFPPRVLRLESLRAEFCTESEETTDSNGNKTTTYWNFYRVDVTLTADPHSYDRLYANVGTRVYKNGALQKLWSWTDRKSGKAASGTYAEALASGASDIEPISENVPLLPNGSGVSPIPTYRVGSPFEPVDFSALGLPTDPPEHWNVVDN